MPQLHHEPFLATARRRGGARSPLLPVTLMGDGSAP